MTLKIGVTSLLFLFLTKFNIAICNTVDFVRFIKVSSNNCPRQLMRANILIHEKKAHIFIFLLRSRSCSDSYSCSKSRFCFCAK